MADIFNYEGVKACMGTLDSKFSEFAEILKKANDYVNENIHVSHDSALYGDLGKKMLDSWNENASTFSDFYENFTSWSQLMASIMASYGNFENQTVQQALGTHQTTGANLKGVQETRDALAYNTQLKDQKALLNKELGKEYKVIEEGVTNKEQLANGQVRYTYVDGSVVTYTMKNNQVDKMVVEKANGTIETKYKLEDGGSVVEKYDKSGKPVSSNIVDPKGNVIMTREYTGQYENEKITYYDTKGNVIDTVRIEGRGLLDDRGMKNMSTSDMYAMMSRGGTRGVTTEELARETAYSAMDNNIGGGSFYHTYDDFRLVDKTQTTSYNDAKYVQQRVQDRQNNAPEVQKKIDIEEFKEEQGYASVDKGTTPSGYNGGGSGYNPGGSQQGGTYNPQTPTGNGGIQRVPYTGTNGGNPQPLPNNGGQPQVVPLNNNGNSGYNPNNGNTTPQPSGPVYYV